jgi:hypothetical protein
VTSRYRKKSVADDNYKKNEIKDQQGKTQPPGTQLINKSKLMLNALPKQD